MKPNYQFLDTSIKHSTFNHLIHAARKSVCFCLSKYIHIISRIKHNIVSLLYIMQTVYKYFITKLILKNTSKTSYMK